MTGSDMYVYAYVHHESIREKVWSRTNERISIKPSAVVEKIDIVISDPDCAH
jgi:hypothetical protein